MEHSIIAFTSNKNEVAVGTVQAGDMCEATVTLPEGINKIAVTVSNEIGRSPKKKQEAYIGFDTPLPAKNVRLNIDAAQPCNLKTGQLQPKECTMVISVR